MPMEKERDAKLIYAAIWDVHIAPRASHPHREGIAVDEQISKLPQTKLPLVLLKGMPFLQRRAQSFWPVARPFWI